MHCVNESLGLNINYFIWIEVGTRIHKIILTFNFPSIKFNINSEHSVFGLHKGDEDNAERLNEK